MTAEQRKNAPRKPTCRLKIFNRKVNHYTLGRKSMDDARIRELVGRLDTAKALDGENAWGELRPLGAAVLPFLAEFYPKARKWQGRAALIFHAMGYARTSETAFQLGLAALRDKATIVRYRACGLCAYSLRSDAVAPLKQMLEHPEAQTVADARAAIDAIQRRNHHYFVDRNHSGQSFWEVNPGDIAA